MRNSESSRAATIAFRLLKYRPRSEKEIKDRLRKKDISRKVIENMLEKLKQAGLIDDRGFAKFWIRSRLKKGYWFYRIQKELQLKGVDQQVYLPLIDKYRNDSQGLSIIRGLVEKRSKRYKGQDSLKVKRKIFMYLKRRGFSYSDIKQVFCDYEDF